MKGKITFLTKALTLLIVALFSLTGARAQQTLPYEYGFENNNLSTDGWVLQGATNNYTGISTDSKRSGTYGFRFQWSEQSAYLMSPILAVDDIAVDVSFWYKEYNSQYGDEQFYVGYTTDENETDASKFTYGNIVTASTSWQEYSESFPPGIKRIAIKYVYNDAFYLFLDDFSFTQFVGTYPPYNLSATEVAPTSTTLNWEGSYDSYVLQYRTAAQDMNLGAWHQVGEDKAATATLQTYTFDLSEYSGTGYIAIRHYNSTDMFYLNVDDIVLTNAGGSIVFSEDFESNSLGSLSTQDLDGDGYNWGMRENGSDSNGNNYCNGSYSATSASWISGVGALTPDNWLVLSNVELGGTLTFVARGQDPSWPAENFVTNESGTFNTIPAGEWSDEIASTASPYTLTGLTPNTSYEWRVKGIIGGEESDWATSTFSTIRDNFKTFVTAGNWDVAENWYPVGVPALTDDVSITKAATIPAGVVAVAKRVSLDGGSVTIKNGGELKQGAATLKVTVEKDIAAGMNTLIASPISGQTKLEYDASWNHVLHVTEDNYDLYAFDPTQENEWVNYENNPTHTYFESSSGNPGLQYNEGYFYANEADKTFVFTGTTLSSLNNLMTKDITFNGTNTDSFNGWRLIGNPFTCTGYITYSGTATFFKLNAAGTGFDIYQNAVELAPGEGAFIKVTTSGTITYSSEPLAVEPVAAGTFLNIALPAHGEATDQDADPIISTISFANNGNNTELIESLDGQTVNAQLTGRRLFKDGGWNTICLPFDVRDFTGTPLEGADMRALGSVNYQGNTLTLNFSPIGSDTKVAAGRPYIIRWTGGGDDISDPVFENVTIDKTTYNDTEYTFANDVKISFLGTYAYTLFENEDKSILFMGDEDKLYYPLSGASLGAFRAYFKLENVNAGEYIPNEAIKFVMKFVEDDPTGIDNLNANVNANEAIYNVAGQRVNKMQKGIYINNGKKTLVK